MYKMFFLAAFVVFYTHLYIYQKGLIDGEQNYKKSIRIFYALKSAYHFGYLDCQQGRMESWDGSN